jgi:hypothetical protein
MGRLFLIILLLLVNLISYSQTKYYFNNNLSNGGNGTYTTPWNHMDSINSIHQSITNLEIYFHESLYPYTRTKINADDTILFARRNNTSGLKIASYNNNPKSSNNSVIFDGQNLFSIGFHIQPGSSSTQIANVRIENVEFKNFVKHAISVRGDSTINKVDTVKIQNCKISDISNDLRGDNSAGISVDRK